MFDLRAHTHLLVVGGSRAYGLATPRSDVDLKGVAIPPASVVLGFQRGFEQADQTGDMDVFADLLTDEEQAVVRETKLEGGVFGLQKFARLAADCNPHVLDALFCRDAEVRLCTPIGEQLRELAPRFLSQRARFSFGGYASAQLKRIENHRAWLLAPPPDDPTRADFDLPENPPIPKAQIDAAHAAVRKQLDRWELDLSGVPGSTIVEVQSQVETVLTEIVAGHDRWRAAAAWVGLSEDFVQYLQRERQYKRAKQHVKQYRHWVANRNPVRAALEAKYGYDTKHASHLVRLLCMALEIVATGAVHVWRGDRDAELLREIKAGAWSYQVLMEWVERTNASIDAAMATTPLPRSPDRDGLNAAVAAWTLSSLTG